MWWLVRMFLCGEYRLLKNKHRFIISKTISTNYVEPCVSACVSSRWTFGQKLGHRRYTETVSPLCDCRKKIDRSHDWKAIESLSFGLKSIFRWVQSTMLASNSPSNVLLKIKVFGEDFVTEITLQLWTFSFQLLCWGVKFNEWIFILRTSSYIPIHGDCAVTCSFID